MFARVKWLPLHFPANVRVILSATVTGTELGLATGAPLRTFGCVASVSGTRGPVSPTHAWKRGGAVLGDDGRCDAGVSASEADT